MDGVKLLEMDPLIKQERLEKIATIGLTFNTQSKERLDLKKALEYPPHTEERIKALELFFKHHFADLQGWINPGKEKIWPEDQLFLSGVPSTKQCFWWFCYGEEKKKH